MRARGRIFLLDDDELIVSMLARALKGEGYEVRVETDPAGCVEKIGSFRPDVVLLDIKLPGKSGLDLLSEILAAGIARQVIMLTSDDSAETAVRAMKLGAGDYLTKPFNLDELKIVVGNAVEKGTLRQEVDYLRKISSELTQRRIIGESDVVVHLKEQAAKLAEARVPTILITGESGVGKEVFARHTHDLIHRGDSHGYAPFVGINCAALPEPLIESELFGHEKGAFTDAKTDKKGVFEMAYGGSILLDEIAEMRPSLQSKLLRVLEERQLRRVGGRRDIPVDATVFATTNKDLNTVVDTQEFRADLFYRLSAFSMNVPPLRERQADIPLLARHFLELFCRRYNRAALRGFSSEAEGLLQAHGWPGNIRELRNVVERIVVLETCETILPEHLPRSVQRKKPTEAPREVSTISLPDGGMSMDEVQEDLIKQALEKSRGNKTRAAKLLGMTYDTLRYQIKKFGLD